MRGFLHMSCNFQLILLTSRVLLQFENTLNLYSGCIPNSPHTTSAAVQQSCLFIHTLSKIKAVYIANFICQPSPAGLGICLNAINSAKLQLQWNTSRYEKSHNVANTLNLDWGLLKQGEGAAAQFHITSRITDTIPQFKSSHSPKIFLFSKIPRI